MLNSGKIEVGKEILSYCGKCKEDSVHIVSAMEKDKISKVMCRTCNAQHNYRKPKSLAADKSISKISKTTKAASPRKTAKKTTKKWDDLVANYDLSEAQDYTMKNDYEESSLIKHSSFGIGIIIKKVNQTRMEVQFEVGMKLLLINKK